MSFSIGTLGLVSLRNPFAEVVGMVLGKSDIRTMFCLVVFCIISLILAYLTNPSENSFRAYLTEQSFRHHLSRLDDHVDDDQVAQDDFTTRSPPKMRTTPSGHAANKSSSFHFANRASVSLRTPKHVFHSFAVFTIAAMVPLSEAGASDDRDGRMISDSWYIGAFGKWWRGGVLENWYQDVIARSKDEESWSSGILSMKSLDMFQDFNGSTYSTKNLPPHLTRGSPPRLRNRERPTQRSTATPARSSTPPPLPKTASLPLHTTRLPLASIERSCDYLGQGTPHSHAQPSPVDSMRIGPSLPSRSSSAAFEQSPVIAEVLRQISSVKSSVLELRSQLSECQTAASQSHHHLQTEVDACRERKRQEDLARLEIKSRTKSLDDSKRSAESLKREAEKKLRMVQSVHDGANQRMDYLDKEIGDLGLRLREDRDFLQTHKTTISNTALEIAEALEQKRQEIKVTEDVVSALNQRSRELEEKLLKEKERLRNLKEMADFRKQDLSLSLNTSDQLCSDPRLVSYLPDHDAVNGSTMVVGQCLSTGNITTPSSPCDDNSLQTFNRTSPLYSLQRSPFADVALGPINPQGFFAPADQSDNSSRSFQSDTDAFLDRDWRGNTSYTSSPTSIGNPFEMQRSPWLKSLDDENLDDRCRRWPFMGKAKRGLNPDAKEFSLSRKSSPGVIGGSSPYDALNPNGLGISAMTASTSSSLLRAFAPLPEEREALQRALGGSTNTSFERLPSLSDVGSISSSPSHSHALLPHPPAQEMGKMIPSWLQALPRMRKVNFSPWDDEEPSGQLENM